MKGEKPKGKKGTTKSGGRTGKHTDSSKRGSEKLRVNKLLRQGTNATVFKPGQKTPLSGVYRATKGGAEVVLVQGKRVPPTVAGGGYILRSKIVKTGGLAAHKTSRLGAKASGFRLEGQIGGDWTGGPPPPPPKRTK